MINFALSVPLVDMILLFNDYNYFLKFDSVSVRNLYRAICERDKKNVLIFHHLQARLNDTEELEARVTVLEESVADLETNVVELIDEVDDIESSNILQEERLNTLDQEVNDNIDDIEGADFSFHHICP